DLRAQGYLTAVVSNKADFAVQELCAQYFGGLFDAVIGEREGIRRKPYPDSVEEVLHRLAVSRAEAVYIGDSEVDIAMARNAGMDCIIVDWGFREREYLREMGASEIVSSCDELFGRLVP
ncbi:MAG: HAD-IA family hydrolase, partial [Clostridia bacterium]|nr:HAD-IA family hydrolase [Clostridia bacterium]